MLGRHVIVLEVRQVSFGFVVLVSSYNGTVVKSLVKSKYFELFQPTFSNADNIRIYSQISYNANNLRISNQISY